MIREELLAKYSVLTIEMRNEVCPGFTNNEECMYRDFLTATDHIPLKIFEGSLTTADCVEELEAREYSRMRIAELTGDDYTPKTTKNIEERTVETENVFAGLLDEDSNPQTAAEMRLVVQMFAQTITDDSEALSVKSIYPPWESCLGKTVKQGFKFTYEDDLYKVIQPELTLSDTYPPGDGTESLYTKIDETHAGTPEDPIPYDGNMELFEGLYYIQNDVIYVCIRDSGTPLYHDLADLVGLYVNVYEAE